MAENDVSKLTSKVVHKNQPGQFFTTIWFSALRNEPSYILLIGYIPYDKDNVCNKEQKLRK